MVHLEGPEARIVAVKPENLTSSSTREACLQGETCAHVTPSAATSGQCDRTSSTCCQGGLAQEERRKLNSKRLAVPRRRRLVEKTLDAVRNDFDPTEGLAEAAEAAAREVLLRTEESQRETSSLLAQPRVSPSIGVEENETPIVRSKVEQQKHCAELARPRLASEDSDDTLSSSLNA